MKTEDIGTRYSPWKPEQDPARQAILGKTQEELCELGIAIARCQIQGIDEVNPTTQEINRNELADKLDDAEVMIKILREEFKIQRNFDRQHRKYRVQQAWYADIAPERIPL